MKFPIPICILFAFCLLSGTLKIEAQSLTRTSIQSVFSFVHVPECLDISDVPIDEIYLLDARDNESWDVIETYSSVGAFSIERTTRTPGVNRPFSTTGPISTILSMSGLLSIASGGDIYSDVPASNAQLEMLAMAESMFTDFESFPLIDLVPPAVNFWETDGDSDLESTIVGPGIRKVIHQDTVTIYNENVPSVKTKFTDNFCNCEVEKEYVFEIVDSENQRGRILYEQLVEYPVLSTGDTICQRTLTTHEYLNNSDQEGRLEGETNEALAPSIEPQILREGDNIKLRWQNSETNADGQCKNSTISVFSLAGGLMQRSHNILEGEVITFNPHIGGIFVLHVQNCNGITATRIFQK